MPYPTIGEYKDAIRLAEHSFGSLTHLRPEYDATGDLHFSSGNFAVVFKMRDTRTNRPVAVKCFVREQPLRRQRYEQISACLDALPYSPYLLRYTYHPAEIWVETALSEQREFEVVTLDWIEGQTLYNYLKSRCDAGDGIALRKAAEAFDRLATWLLAQPFAHGDLKPDNILVTPRGELVLVDYDGMFTPDMAGQEATELGSPAFRHPRRSLRDFGKHIDHVPILVLSLSLRVLAEHSDWLKTYYQGDNLILTANDLSKPDSPIFHTIRTQCSAWTTQNRLLGLVNALMLPTLVGIPPVYLKSVPDYDEVKLFPYVKFFKYGMEKWGYCDEHKNGVIDFLFEKATDFREDIAIVGRGGKWGGLGFINKTGEEIIPCIYDGVRDFHEGMARVRRDIKWGFIDKTGKEIIPCIYDGVKDFREGLAGVERNYKWGFIDKTGQEIVSCIYDGAENIREGLARVKRDDKWGFIDKTGQEVIPCIYDCAWVFSESVAQVKKEYKWGFIDKTGKEVIPCIYDEIESSYEGFAKSKRNEKWGFIDKTGKEIIPCIYDGAENIREGLARVKRDDKWGFIDKTGQEVIPCIYEEIGVFFEGLARVKRDDKWGFIDKTGKEIIPCIYDGAQNFREGLARVKRDDKWGFIDKTGKEIIPFIYDGTDDFREGLAGVKRDYRYGFIDKTGQEVIPCIYDSAWGFSESVAQVKKGYKWGFIDKTGQEIIPCIYSEIGSFHEGLAKSKRDEKWGFIDKSGKEVIPCIYDNIEDLHGWSFSHKGLVMVNRKWKTFNKWFYIDKKGTEYWIEEE